MSKTKNNIPYERQMLPILRNYDKLVEENKAMKVIIANISKVCKPEDTVLQFKKLDGQVKDLTNRLNVCKKKLGEIDNLVRDKLEREHFFVSNRSTTLANVRLLTK